MKKGGKAPCCTNEIRIQPWYRNVIRPGEFRTNQDNELRWKVGASWTKPGPLMSSHIGGNVSRFPFFRGWMMNAFPWNKLYGSIKPQLGEMHQETNMSCAILLQLVSAPYRCHGTSLPKHFLSFLKCCASWVISLAFIMHPYKLNINSLGVFSPS